MPPDSYLDFDLLIESSDAGYRAEVVDSPAGQAAQAFTLPFSEGDLELFVHKVFRLTTRRSIRAIGSPEMTDVRSFGGHLFETLFAGPVSTCLLRSMDEADRNQAGLRIRLRLGEAPGLANVPWEFLYDGASDGFLCLSAETPVVRYIDLPQRVEPLAATPPLRMLTLISSPAGYPPLDVEHEWNKLSEALGPITKEGRLVIDRVETPSLEALQRKLRRAEYHILHFIGHGAFDEGADDGVLLLEDLEGRGHPVTGESLGVLLHDHDSLRLVLLNACEGARTSTTDPFAGTAQSLVRKGIPAVIAMQFEISDVAAITLANEFYAALADGFPVDGALSEARKAIFTRVNAVEWATPVLYMRSPDGRIFEIEDQDERQQVRAKRQDEGAAGAAAAPTTPVAAPEPDTGLETAPVALTEPKTVTRAEPAAVEVGPRTEPFAPSHPETPTGPPRPPRVGGPWRRPVVIVPAAIAAAIALIVVVVTLLSGGGQPGPSPSGPTTSGPRTSGQTPPPAATLSDLEVIPVSSIQRGPRGEVLRVDAGEGGGFGAVGRDGSRAAAWISADGRAWTGTTLPAAGQNAASQQAQGIVEGGPGLVAVGYEVSGEGEEYAAVWTSSDGSTWQAWDQPALHGFGATRMNRIALDGRSLIAVGRSGGNAVLWSSPDGIAWNPDATGVFDARQGERLALRDALEGTNHVVAVGESSVNGAAAWYRTKPSGLWRRARVNGAQKGQSLISVAGGPERFVAVGYTTAEGEKDAAVWTSADGTIWTRASTKEDLHETGGQEMRGVAYLPDLGFVAVGIDGTDAAVWISEDGLEWSRSSAALAGTGERQMRGITATATQVIVVGLENGAPAIWAAEL